MTEAEIISAIPYKPPLSDQIPWIEGPDGYVIDLGPANPSALRRMAIYTQSLVDAKAEIPPSGFVERYAERVTAKDKQDLILFLSGKRGSGKSYSFLYIATRFAEAIARRMGGVREDYFSILNCALLEDSHRILELLSTSKKYQVILIDDVSIGAGAKSWNSQANKNFGKVITVCRDRRWLLLLCAPLKKNADNTIREYTDLHGRVYKSFHEGGFNIIKINVLEVMESGDEYKFRLKFNGRKVDFYAALSPEPELAEIYDIQRAEASYRLNVKLAKDGNGEPSPMPSRTLADRNLDEFLQKYSEDVRQYFKTNPNTSMNQLAQRFMKSNTIMGRVCVKLGIQIKKRGEK